MESKKDIYINNTLTMQEAGDTMFNDIYIEHNSLPEINFDDIDTSTYIFGKKIDFPLIISPMTGGSEKGYEINEKLIYLSKLFNIPFAVGSQQDELIDENNSKLFLETRDNEKFNHILIANLSAKASLNDIEKAMKQINANAISLYLNSTQEAISFDGNKDFSNILDRISEASQLYRDNLIVKEKGSGMSKRTVESLVKAGVKYIDISGFGGTNIVEMENLRNYRNDFSELYCWGIPTAKSIINAKMASDDVKIIASGGIKTGLDVAKALIIGADYVSVAGELLKYLLHGDMNQAKSYLESIIYKTKVVMFLLGVKNIEELKKVNYKVTGKLKEIL